MIIVKRILALTLVLLLVLGSLSGCGPQGPKAEKEPFVLETEEELAVANLMNQGSAAQLYYSTPFYSGGDLLGQNTLTLDQLRREKVSQLTKRAEVMRLGAVEVSNGMTDARDALLAFAEAQRAAGMGEAAEALAAPIREKESNLLQYGASALAFSEQVGENDLMEAYARYMWFVESVEMTAAVLDEATYIVTMSSLAIDAAGSGGDGSLAAAASALDEALASFLDSHGEDLQGLEDSMITLDYGLRQLETSDFHYVSAVSGFVREESAALAPKLEGLKAEGELDEETLTFLRDFNKFYEVWAQDLVVLAKPTDENRLITVSAEPTEFGWWTAYAETADEYGKAVAALNGEIPEQKAPAKGYLASGWDAIKRGAGEFKKAVGVSADVLGGVIYEKTRSYYGQKYGNTPDEIARDLKEKKQEIQRNYQAGRSGADTFKTAGGYLEGADKTVGDLVGGAVDKAVNGAKAAAGYGRDGSGSGTYAGSIANFLAKTTMGMFTDFGKGVYKVMNTTSTQGEMASGFLDIGMSCIGGSKVLFKASALGRGAAKAGAAVTKGAANFAERKLTGASLAKLTAGRGLVKEGTELTAKEMAVLLEKETLIAQTQSMMKLLEAQKAALREQFTKILQDGGEFAWMNAKKEVKETLQSTFRESLTDQLMATLKALKETPSKSMVDYLDFIVGEVSDDVIKDAVEDFVDSAAGPEVKPGVWTGQVTVTQVYYEGKDGAADGLNVGVTAPLEMEILTRDDHGGRLIFTMDDPDEEPLVTEGPYTLEGLEFKANYDQYWRGSVANTFEFTGTLKGNVVEGTFKYHVYRNEKRYYIADGTFVLTRQ